MFFRTIKILAIFVVVVIVTGAGAYLALTTMIKGEDAVMVPELESKDILYALKVLSDLGLNTKVNGSEYNELIPENHIIYQEPASGARIKKGRDVRLILSKGLQIVTMPNVQKLSVQQANVILEENGLCSDHSARTYDASTAPGDVIAQTPRPGTMVHRGRCANLLVSRGPRPRTYMMPELGRHSIEDAILMVERTGLVVAKISTVSRPGTLRQAVFDQRPPAGSRVTEGSPVEIMVNRGSGFKTESTTSGRIRVGFFRHRLNPGFLKKRIRVRLNSMGELTDVFDNYVRPGEEIWLLIPTNEDTMVLVYENDTLVSTQMFGAR